MKKREKHWKMMKKQEQKNNEKWWPREKKTRNTYEKEWQKMKHDEKEKKNNEKWWRREKQKQWKMIKNDERVVSLFFLSFQCLLSLFHHVSLFFSLFSSFFIGVSLVFIMFPCFFLSFSSCFIVFFHSCSSLFLVFFSLVHHCSLFFSSRFHHVSLFFLACWLGVLLLEKSSVVFCTGMHEIDKIEYSRGCFHIGTCWIQNCWKSHSRICLTSFHSSTLLLQKSSVVSKFSAQACTKLTR